MINRERINNMSNKEFAEFMDMLNGYGNGPFCKFCEIEHKGNKCYFRCIEGYEKWLESEVEDYDK